MHSDTKNLTWPEFQALSLEEKKADFNKNGQLRHNIATFQANLDHKAGVLCAR